MRQIFNQYTRSKWPEFFTRFYFQVDQFLHFRVSGISQDTSVSQCTRTEFHSSLEPTDHFSLSYPFTHERGAFFEVIKVLVGRFVCIDRSENILIRVRRAKVCTLHCIRKRNSSSFYFISYMIRCISRTQSTASITCCWLDPDIFKYSSISNF